MKIIEEFIFSKTGNYLDCEDGIFKSEDFISVIDGATSKTDFKYKNKKTGKVAEELISDCLCNLAFNSTAYEAIEIISKSIYDFYSKHSLLNNVKENPEYRLSASIVIYSNYRQEVWLVGDCQAMIGEEKIINPKAVDEILSNLRSLFIDIQLQNGKDINYFQKHDHSRDYIKPLLIDQSKLQNNHKALYGYACIDGFKIRKDEIKIFKVPCNCESIILASDGYPTLERTLESSEKELIKILKLDPLLFREYKSTKGLLNSNVSYDDRSYIRFNPGK